VSFLQKVWPRNPPLLVRDIKLLEFDLVDEVRNEVTESAIASVSVITPFFFRAAAMRSLPVVA
jgi:hypothetical protein